jgi:hypothetical protein
MKFAVVACFVLLVVNQKVNGVAEDCDTTKCDIQDNCRCSSTTSPLDLNDTPQLIVLAFVDAAKDDLYIDRWSPLVEPRSNPDGEYIGATFFVPHEYSDYQIVHDLAANGFEIGVHSVTNDAHQSYWRDATQALLEQEFGAQRKILAKFANIPEEKITGTLTPQLQLAGENSINAFTSQGFSYDNSWPSRTQLFPYTLDYASTQVCDTGANCPKESHKGFWMAPIVDLTSDDGSLCATIASCFGSRNNQTAKEFSDWLVQQVTSVKNLNRAPLTLIIEENLFKSVNESWAGLNDALDKIQEDQDIFFVSQARVIEWIKNPVPIAEFKTGNQAVDTSCNKETCTLTKSDGTIRYMVSCVPCPKNYPWLDNPEGN